MAQEKFETLGENIKITLTITHTQARTLFSALRGISDTRDDLHRETMKNINAIGKLVAHRLGLRWAVNNRGVDYDSGGI